MGIAAVARRRLLRFAVGCVALWSGGCLASKLGYNNAPTLIRWTIGDYVDLDPGQRDLLDQALRRIHVWHRRAELPVYAALAGAAAGRIESGLTARDLDWAEAAFRARYDALAAELAGQLAAVAGTIAPEQLGRMDRKFAHGNERYRSEQLDVPPAVRTRRAVREGLELIEDWVGHLEPGQRRVLGARLAALPDLADHAYAQRLARQRAIRELVEARPPREGMVAGLRLWLIGLDAGRTAEHERLHAERMLGIRRLMLGIDGMLTPKQRAHVVEKLRELGEDFLAWSRKPVPE